LEVCCQLALDESWERGLRRCCTSAGIFQNWYAPPGGKLRAARWYG